jgi:hypothetical protein
MCVVMKVLRDCYDVCLIRGINKNVCSIKYSNVLFCCV